MAVLSFWESVEAVRAVAGHDLERAVTDAEDDRFLVEADAAVVHYEVVEPGGEELTA